MDLLNVNQAAKELHISIHTLRSWIYQKRLPYVKLGRKCLFKQEDLEVFVNQSMVKAKGNMWNVQEEMKESKKQKKN